jgi:hypothetical protein
MTAPIAPSLPFQTTVPAATLGAVAARTLQELSDLESTLFCGPRSTGVPVAES